MLSEAKYPIRKRILRYAQNDGIGKKTRISLIIKH